jgi:hypothetical protein
MKTHPAKNPQICSGFLINRHNSAIFLDFARMRALMCQTALLLSRKVCKSTPLMVLKQSNRAELIASNLPRSLHQRSLWQTTVSKTRRTKGRPNEEDNFGKLPTYRDRPAVFSPLGYKGRQRPS